MCNWRDSVSISTARNFFSVHSSPFKAVVLCCCWCEGEWTHPTLWRDIKKYQRGRKERRISNFTIFFRFFLCCCCVFCLELALMNMLAAGCMRSNPLSGVKWEIEEIQHTQTQARSEMWGGKAYKLSDVRRKPEKWVARRWKKILCAEGEEEKWAARKCNIAGDLV